MKKYLIAGLLVWLPLAVTIWVLQAVLGLLNGVFVWLLAMSQVVLPEGSVARMIAAGRKAPRGDDIVLRRASAETRAVHGTEVASEALLPLDLGPGRRPALLLMGSLEPTRFSPAHGTDLLRFFAQVFRLVLIRWLRE